MEYLIFSPNPDADPLTAARTAHVHYPQISPMPPKNVGKMLLMRFADCLRSQEVIVSLKQPSEG